MKSKKVLAQLAALSLAFGLVGTGVAWADEIVISGSESTTAEGITVTKNTDGSFSVSDQSVKGVWLTEKAKLTANNVNFVNGGEKYREVGLDSGSTLIMNGGSIDTEMDYFAADGGSTAEINNAKVTTGAWANNSTITLKDSTTTGDVLYAGNEWGEGEVAEGLPEGRLTIDGGTATVGNVLVQNKAVFTVTNQATLDLTGDTSALDEEATAATGITNKGNITIRAWGPNTNTAEKSNNAYVQSLDQAAQLHVDGGSTVKADTIDLYGYGHREQDDNVYRGKMDVLGNSSVTVNTMNIGTYGYASFTDSQLTVNGTLSITGIGREDNYKYPYGLDINGGSATLSDVSLESWGEMTLTGTTATAKSISNDSSIMTISGSTLEADAIDLKGHKDDDTTYIYRGKMYVSEDSTITADTMNVGAYGYGSFTDSQLTVNEKLSIEGLGEDDGYDKPYGVEINGGSATLGEVSLENYGELTLSDTTVTAGNISNNGSIMKLSGSTLTADNITAEGGFTSIPSGNGRSYNFWAIDSEIEAATISYKTTEGSFRGELENAKVIADTLIADGNGFWDFDVGSATIGTVTVENGGQVWFQDMTTDITGTITVDKDSRVEVRKGTTFTADKATVTGMNANLDFWGNSKATLNEVTATGTDDEALSDMNGAIIVRADSEYGAPDVTISKLTLKDKAIVNITGGKLTANDITAAEGTKIAIKDTGILSTLSSQVYTNSAANNQKDSGDAKAAFTFTAGTLELTDATYTRAYLNSALAAMSKQTEDSETKLIMSGKQVDENGEEIKTNTIDEMKNKSDGVILDQVTVTSDKNFLIGTEETLEDSTVSGVTVADQIANGFGAKDLTLANGEGNVGVVITNDKTLTLGGKADGDLITVVDSTGAAVNKAVKVVVGTTTEVADGVKTAGTFTIGNAAVDTSTKYTLNGTILVNKDSALNVNGQATISDGVTLAGGSAAVKEGSKLTTATLDIQESSAVTGAANVTEEVNIIKEKVLAVGDATTAGKLAAKKLSGEGMIFLDPDWVDGKGIEAASGMAVADVSEPISNALVAGQNSFISFGTEGYDEIYTAFAKTGETWGKDGITAAAYVAAPVTLGSTGSITIDGSQATAPTATNGAVTFAANSMLLVNGAKVTETAAISGVTSLTIDEGAKLFIDNAEKGKLYKILEGSGVAEATKWDAANILSNNSLLKFARGQSSTGAYNLWSEVKSMEETYGKNVIIAPNVYDKALKDGASKALEEFALNAAKSTVNATTEAQVSALNSAMATSELAGAARGTYTAAGLFHGAVEEHMSLANARTHDKDVWAKYIHNKEDIDGLSIAGSNATYKNKYNGIVVGADVYHNGKATVGVALTYGDGDISGNTLVASTKNDAKYYGASIYGGIRNGETAILGDISYLHSKNDITQQNSGKTITGTEKSNAFSIGVRAERSLKAGDGHFVPYAGLRYMHLTNSSYTDSLGVSHDGDDLNLWLLPIGVKYSMDAKHGSWTLRPIAEIGYVWNMGDRDANEVVRLDGASDTFGYDVTDRGSYLGRLGFEAEKGNTTFGIGYQYQKGSSVKENRWSASVNYRF